MAVSVHIPVALSRLYGTAPIEQCDPGSVASILATLEARHAGLGDRLREPDGTLRRYVNVFVDGEDVRWHDGVETSVPNGAEVRIVPSVAGG